MQPFKYCYCKLFIRCSISMYFEERKLNSPNFQKTNAFILNRRTNFLYFVYNFIKIHLQRHGYRMKKFMISLLFLILIRKAFSKRKFYLVKTVTKGDKGMKESKERVKVNKIQLLLSAHIQRMKHPCRHRNPQITRTKISSQICKYHKQ